VQNLLVDPRVRVQVGRRWYTGTAAVLADYDPWLRRQRLDDACGWLGRLDGSIFRAAATTPHVVRVDLARVPGET
jgi:hypothetical protein